MMIPAQTDQRLFSACNYSAFLSYATADDDKNVPAQRHQRFCRLDRAHAVAPG